MDQNIPEHTKFWKDIKPEKGVSNNPTRYSRELHMDRGKNIFTELKNLKISNGKSQSQSDVQPKASLGNILEIGCNCGRNLEFLRRNNFTNLTGIDINKHAFEHMNEVYPELYKLTTKKIGLIENVIDTIDNIYDVSFTIAVLMHIDKKERSKIYKWLSTHSRYIIFIEPYFEEGTRRIKEGRLVDNKIDPRDELTKLGFKLIRFSDLYYECALKKFKMLVMKNTKIL